MVKVKEFESELSNLIKRYRKGGILPLELEKVLAAKLTSLIQEIIPSSLKDAWSDEMSTLAVVVKHQISNVKAKCET